MVFPASFATVLLAALLSLLFGALWTLTYRAAGKWRFELYALDFVVGVAVAALAIALTLGTLGSEIAMFDNLNIMRKSSVMFLLGVGALVNLGVFLLLAAVSVTGIAVAFLTGMSFAVVVSAIGLHGFAPLTSPLFLGLGVVLMLAAIATAARAFSARVRQRDTDMLQKAVAAGVKGKLARTSPLKGLLLAIASGLLLGLAQPLAAWVQFRDEIPFGAYSICSLFAVSFLAAGPFFALFFLNLPVQGEALSFGGWMRGTGRQHLLGIAGGAIWYAGLIALFLAASPDARTGFPRGLGFALGRGAVVCGGAIGLLAVQEFANSAAARGQAMVALVLAAAGLAVFALAPVV